MITIPLPDITAQYIPAARVHLLDEGCDIRVQTTKLYELPDASSLERFPPEIIEVFVIAFAEFSSVTIGPAWRNYSLLKTFSVTLLQMC